MRCSKCGNDSTSGRKFCPECGSLLSHRCAKCGADNSPTAKFCEDCGAPLGVISAAPAKKSNDSLIRVAEIPAAENLEGERKTVTMLFADIKGSTELMEDLDPEEARRIVDPALKLMVDAVRRYGGYIPQSTGDGIFAVFGAPVAHEDHPRRALHAALRMQEDLRHYSAKMVAEGGLPLQCRVGVNTGEVIVRSISTGENQTEYAPIGHTTNLASRMQAVAPVGSIAVAESTRKLCEGYFALKSLGPTRVKGVSEPVNVYEVTGLGPLRTRLQRAAARGYTKFIGRDREMEALRRAAEQAEAGHGQVVSAVAEPGVGKSRLFFEFKATSQSGWLVLDAPALSHEKATAYAPLMDLLHVYFRITPDDDARTRREKVAGKVTMLDRSLEETLPHLFALLGIVEGVDPLTGMDEQIRQRRTQDAVKRVLLRESLNRPLMLIFEDLHWIDDATQGFLNLFAEGVGNAPVLLLVNYRPEYTHQWGGKTYYTQLRLDPLGEDSATEMLSARIGDSPELVPLKQLVLERTEGNPLFIEELVEALFDEGVLVRNGAVKVTRPLSQLKIPPTVQGILAARIDGLPPEAKELLQTLAVIGSEFPLALVRQVVRLPDDRLDQLLDLLQAGEFIYEQPAMGDVEYRFKHTLTCDEASNSLLKDRRKLLHERTAQAIETLHHERLEDHYTHLVHHYRSSNNAAKTIEYLRLVGEQAMRRGAHVQAVAAIEPALKLIERLPGTTQRLRAELGIRQLQASTLPNLQGLASAERLENTQRVCELSEQLGDDSALLRGLYNLGSVYLIRGQTLSAREVADRGLALAEQNQDLEMLPPAQLLVARCAYFAGNLFEAASRYKDLIKGLVSTPRRITTGIITEPWILAPLQLALVEQLLGRPDEALRLCDEGLRRASQFKHPSDLVMALMISARVRGQRGEPDAARELSEAAQTLVEKHISGRVNSAVMAWAKAELGQTEQALAELESWADSAMQFDAEILRPQVYMRVGRIEQALEMLNRYLAQLESSGTRHNEAEVYRLKGEAILMRDSSSTAEPEACYRKAIEIAHGQSAKWWELRSTNSLARLLAKQGKREEAREMLADVYNWFTEGFDTADLKDAKAMLEQLSVTDRR